MRPLWLLLALSATLSVQGEETAPARLKPALVQTRMFDIDYEVNEASLPLTAVRLWYTHDEGGSWQRYGEDEDRQPPFSFLAPSEGLYGFFIVTTNGGGASGPDPTPQTRPQLAVFVDYTPPMVQLHPPRLTTMLSQPVVQIRWTAVDANFASRPIGITYQRTGHGEWQPVAPDPLANTGQFDWRPSSDLSGSVTLQVTAVDRGGFRVPSNTQTVILATVDSTAQKSASPSDVLTALPACEGTGSPQSGPASSKPASAAPSPAGPATAVSTAPSSAKLNAAEAAREQAARLYAQALASRDRGEYRLAVAKLREVVALDPENVIFLNEMAAMLYMIGDYDRALDAYHVALGRQPALRSAVLGAARVHRQRQEYETAAEKLRGLLRHNPHDAQAWMALGDLGVYKGDEILARECYQRAMNTQPRDTAIFDEANQRLTLMTESTRLMP